MFCLTMDVCVGQSIHQYVTSHPSNDSSSRAVGTPGSGSLRHGKLFPYSGVNFVYFDSSSYVNSRAWCHEQLKSTLIKSFEELDTLAPGIRFGVMELSNQHGGPIKPHRTHQNGLSVDLMMPLQKNNEPFTELDQLGASHYLLDFDQNGRWSNDTAVHIDFDNLALLILTIHKQASKQGLKLKKVIINTHLKDELFRSGYGTVLKQSGVYVVQHLEPIVNDLHDDHIHLDFEVIKH